MGTFNFTSKFKKGAQEVIDQIETTRNRKANGHVHFQIANLKNEKLEPLLREAYAEPALVPATPWLDAKAPAEPLVKFELAADGSVAKAEWAQTTAQAADPLDKAFRWVVATKTTAGDPWVTSILTSGETSWTAAEGKTVAKVAVAAVDRVGNMGRAAVVKAALGETTLLNEIDKLLGKPWDDELETFRHAGEGAPVRWLHQVV